MGSKGVRELRPIRYNNHKTNHTAEAKRTTYAEQEFRSRLEARWAIAFDYLGIVWEYEPRTFRTPRGGYLPDFKIWVPKEKFPSWIEVKGPEPVEIDYERAQYVYYETGEKMRFLVGGTPSFDPGAVRTFTTAPYPRFTRARWMPAPAASLSEACERAAKACWGNRGQYIPWDPANGGW